MRKKFLNKSWYDYVLYLILFFLGAGFLLFLIGYLFAFPVFEKGSIGEAWFGEKISLSKIINNKEVYEMLYPGIQINPENLFTFMASLEFGMIGYSMFVVAVTGFSFIMFSLTGIVFLIFGSLIIEYYIPWAKNRNE